MGKENEVFTDDLVKRLREDQPATQDMGSTMQCALQDAAADRIEELEDKLAKAMGALGDISNGEPEWPDDPQRELDWCRNRATTTLAELKGQDDE